MDTIIVAQSGGPTPSVRTLSDAAPQLVDSGVDEMRRHSGVLQNAGAKSVRLVLSPLASVLAGSQHARMAVWGCYTKRHMVFRLWAECSVRK